MTRNYNPWHGAPWRASTVHELGVQILNFSRELRILSFTREHRLISTFPYHPNSKRK